MAACQCAEVRGMSHLSGWGEMETLIVVVRLADWERSHIVRCASKIVRRFLQESYIRVQAKRIRGG
jgi:hypothetical protein